MKRQIAHVRQRGTAGFSIVELLMSTAITVVIVGSTMTAMTSALRDNKTAMLVTSMNSGLRTGMDLMVLDLLQVGQGLPTGRLILTPSGNNSVQINLPGPPATALKNAIGDTDISAVLPGPGLGPVVNGVATDIITTLQADSAFDEVKLTALAPDGSSMTVDPAVDISNGGPDDIQPGQLIMLTKASVSTLVEVTRVDGIQTVFFDAGDSLKLNQPNAAVGSIGALLATAPADVLPAPPAPQFVPTTATRIRMISYYIDATTDPARPRLVRRINNGDPLVFNNLLGSAVAFDVENLQITYDIADGVTNPSNVKMTALDQGVTGACAPNPCSPNQIRKVNIVLSARSRDGLPGTNQFFHNTLTSQVSLRNLSFVDRYR
jgi:hypothetical protein